jgi:ankyrin repeat protein
MRTLRMTFNIQHHPVKHTCNEYELVSKALQVQGNVNVNFNDRPGHMELDWVAYSGYEETSELLQTQNGIDRDSRDHSSHPLLGPARDDGAEHAWETARSGRAVAD